MSWELSRAILLLMTLYSITSLASFRRSWSGFHCRSASMSVTLDLLWYLFLTYRAARHWTMSRRCMSPFSWGSQTVLAYSTVGRTRALYAVSLVEVEEIFRFLHRKLMVRLALLQMFCICWPQSRWLFRVQPRYLAEVTCSSVWP